MAPRTMQQQRSVQSRERLLDAALTCLTERGHAGTTVADVSKRAGLSIGCLQYHFPTKADLLIAAMERVFTERHRRFRQAVGALPVGPERGAQAVRLLWREVCSDAFQAYLELVVASRTDASLRAHLRRLGDRMGDHVRNTFAELFPPSPPLVPFRDVMPALFFSVLEGLALGRIATPHREDIEAAVRALEHLARQHALPVDEAERARNAAR
ncbi:MAG: TetR/AcrR family transcriptional regulator [Myxococcota bacterium]